jgi:hypothetical protein
MKKALTILIVFCIFGTGTEILAQNAVSASGGNASGSGGSVSYTEGQIFYNTISGSNGTVAQGVQQPYEISVVTGLENTEGITLEYLVYPNPTSGLIKLIIKPFDYENWRLRLYDLRGILIQDKKIENEETEISLGNLSSSMYLLKIINDNLEVKVFKIVKR